MLRNCQDFYRKLLPLFFSKNCRTISDAAALTFTYPLFYNNLTGADDAACLYSDDSRSLPLCRYLSFCIDRRHLFIRAAVGDLCLSARRYELRFDCKGFSFIYRVLQ